MSKVRKAAALVCFVWVASLAAPTLAQAGTCQWGGDNGQSMRCFDCMKRIWTGHRWKLKNTCKPHRYDDFNPSGR